MGRYGVAVAVVLLAAIVRWLLDSYLGNTAPLFTFVLAVVVASWYGGYVQAFWQPSLDCCWHGFYSFRRDGHLKFLRPSDIATLTVFLIVGMAIAGFSGTMRSTQVQLRRRERELADFFDNATLGLIGLGRTELFCAQIAPNSTCLVMKLTNMSVTP